MTKMGKIVATCGHEVEDFDDLHHLAFRDTDRECKPCISYGSYCKECAVYFENEGVTLSESEVENFWEEVLNENSFP